MFADRDNGNYMGIAATSFVQLNYDGALKNIHFFLSRKSFKKNTQMKERKA